MCRDRALSLSTVNTVYSVYYNAVILLIRAFPFLCIKRNSRHLVSSDKHHLYTRNRVLILLVYKTATIYYRNNLFHFASTFCAHLQCYEMRVLNIQAFPRNINWRLTHIAFFFLFNCSPYTSTSNDVETSHFNCLSYAICNILLSIDAKFSLRGSSRTSISRPKFLRPQRGRNNRKREREREIIGMAAFSCDDRKQNSIWQLVPR